MKESGQKQERIALFPGSFDPFTVGHQSLVKRGLALADRIIIAIGINNLIAGDTPEETAQGILAVTEAVQKEFPKSRIILLGLYPSGKEANSNIRKKCNRIHELLAEKKWKDVEYINPTNWFTDNNGNIKDGLYIGDYIHLSENGYKIVAEKLKHILSTDGDTPNH